MSTHLLHHPLSRVLRLHFQNARQTQPFLSYRPAPSSRFFHVTRRQNSPILDPILQATHGAFLGIHHVLPWWATIPLAALGTRLAFLPLTLWTRRIISTQRSLTPLLTAWRTALLRSNKPGATSRAKLGHELQVRRKRKEIFKSFSCQSYKLFIAPTLQLPFFLIIIETIRVMAGAGQGLLRTVFSSYTHITGPTGRSAAETTTTTSGAAAAANSEPVSSLAHTHLEPSMATEGPAWFVDLTAPDPLLILPFALSATMFLHLIPSHYLQRSPTAAPTGKLTSFQRRLRNVLKVLALAAGPLTLAMPAGVLYYWISTMMISFVQSLLLDRYMPLKNPVMPCTPPPNPLLVNVGKNAGWDAPVRDAVATKLKAGPRQRP